MNPRYITEWFFDVMPFRRKRASDWILPGVAGLGVGFAAGVGMGILLAPRPGSETREKLRAGADSIKEKARDLADRAKDQLTAAGRPLGLGMSQQSHTSEMHEGR